RRRAGSTSSPLPAPRSRTRPTASEQARRRGCSLRSCRDRTSRPRTTPSSSPTSCSTRWSSCRQRSTACGRAVGLRQRRLELGLEAPLRHGADHALCLGAVLEQDQRRNRENLVLRRRLLVLVGV